MQHRGEIVEKAVRESGYSITRLASKLGKSRRWMYLAFENHNLSIDLVLQIGLIIHHDFSAEIKELAAYTHGRVLHQAVSETGKALIKPEAEAEHWKNKYLELLEKYNQLLETGKAKYPSLKARRKK